MGKTATVPPGSYGLSPPRPVSRHHSTRPPLIQKWQRHAFNWWTDGLTLGRRSQSSETAQRGLRVVLRESCSFSPQPPGHLRQAHFDNSPSCTTTRVPGGNSSGVGCLSMVRATRSGRRTTRAATSADRRRSRHTISRSCPGRDRRPRVPNTRCPRRRGTPGLARRPVDGPAGDRSAASCPKPIRQVRGSP